MTTKTISGRHLLRQYNELKALGYTTLWTGEGKICLQAPPPWVDCGCCGRTHQDLPDDCRAFRTCDKCGDCYHGGRIGDHVKACNGVALSAQPGAVFTYDDDASEVAK